MRDFRPSGTGGNPAADDVLFPPSEDGFLARLAAVIDLLPEWTLFLTLIFWAESCPNQPWSGD